MELWKIIKILCLDFDFKNLIIFHLFFNKELNSHEMKLSLFLCIQCIMK